MQVASGWTLVSTALSFNWFHQPFLHTYPGTEVALLDFTRLEECTLPVASFDIVLAADVIYDDWHAVAVAEVFRRFIRRGRDALCVLTAGDTRIRRGVPAIEPAMLASHFVPLFASASIEQSTFIWHPPE
eukprot:m.66675 g.66675  ORF g.66675 m.66675 type:complete len:130 (-) comp49899_c0_seq8:28-417(-)